MLKRLEKDESQLKKAKIKTSAITCLIPELINLNNAVEEREQKPYVILLDYIPYDGFYKFTVDIKKTYSWSKDPLISIHFSLKSLDEGLSLLDDIRDCYIENNEISYTSFHTNKGTGVLADSFDAIGTNKIDLSYKIHTEEEYRRHQEYDKSLYRNPRVTCKIKKNN